MRYPISPYIYPLRDFIGYLISTLFIHPLLTNRNGSCQEKETAGLNWGGGGRRGFRVWGCRVEGFWILGFEFRV